MSTWIRSVLDSTKELEAPRQFFQWSALSAISAIAADNVWLNRRYFKTYANIYVMLIADSGKGKSLPINFAKNFVAAVDNTRIISGRASIQAILAELGKAKSKEGGGMINTAKGFLVASEFSASLIEDPQAFHILTDLYDTGNYDTTPWINMLKVGGIDTLKQPCLTLLGASNDANLTDTLPKETMRGGFLGRMCLVKTNEKGKPNALLFDDEDADIANDDFNWKQFVPYLKEIAQLKGPFKLGAGVKGFGKEWYDEQFYKENDDITGFENRLQAHTLKVAMLLSLSRSTSMIIERDDLEEAIDLCTIFTINAKRISEGSGKNEFGPFIKILIGELLSAKDYQITKRKFLRKHGHDVSHEILAKVIEDCVQARRIVRHVKDGDDLYELHSEIIKGYEENLKRLAKGKSES